MHVAGCFAGKSPAGLFDAELFSGIGVYINHMQFAAQHYRSGVGGMTMEVAVAIGFHNTTFYVAVGRTDKRQNKSRWGN